ncbi:probable polygalacturonase [Impatiens glandulifera]|uniref:probable polygalacturonase n=1 Tax=Impatiens glandulifera TaxID=253017 RepID=UPI001FB0FCB6|nr:probable polygalacturonase [Impatiens glandulifera]
MMLHQSLVLSLPLLIIHKPALLMKLLAAAAVALVYLAVVSNGSEEGQCNQNPTLKHRPHSVSILEFGAVGDGKTLNTLAFQNAIFYLNSLADKGGAQLYVPPGKWLTGSFNLTSHLTVFLAKGATILGSQDSSNWGIADALPSYGRGVEHPGGRHRSLINGYKLTDVVITGDNGTIDGQGLIWWNWYKSGSLNLSRPHLVELIASQDIVISNITFINSPAYALHPVYCSNVHIHNISVYAPPESPYTVGIVPDSSSQVCIKNISISTGYDAIALKSGWDKYGIAYGKPTTDIHIKQVTLQASTGSGLALGSEMSGGISSILVEQIQLLNSFIGIELRTTKGRGGYIENIMISDVELTNVKTAVSFSGHKGKHPDVDFDPNAIPVFDGITLRNVVGKKISRAGSFIGIEESPFTSICLWNVSLSVLTELDSWVCSDVSGSSRLVKPEPCAQLLNSESSCYSEVESNGRAAI